MQNFIKSVLILSLTMLIATCSLNSLKAQTPSSLPGATPGVTLANGGDGSPEVPFDGGMSLILLASGVAFAFKRVRKIEVNV